MADNIVETRIMLRYGNYTQWSVSNTILAVGEAAICSFPNAHTLEGTDHFPDYTPPAVGIKIGDGIHYFRELPWVQAIAADVYSWAKSSNKPTYTANEIEGLQNYIEEHIPGGGGGGSITVAPRIYQIVQGTGDNINKYYLQYRENTENSQWVVDTTHYIDLEDFVKIKNWLGNTVLRDYRDFESAVIDYVFLVMADFSYNDTSVAHQFVTKVDQQGGLIRVSRAQPTFLDIAGTLSVNQGGTGLTSIPNNTVLVGSAEGLTTLGIADEIMNNNLLVPNYLVKQYVDNAVAGLAGAMHFIGEATVIITNNSAIDPHINDYDFSDALPGDVILSEEKEFVWTGSYWQLLGDESSYAIKGAIVDRDISPDAAIAQSKIANLTVTLDNKVDKIEGKQLSTQDYTTAEKEKLLNIEEGAQANIIEHILLNDVEVEPNNQKTVNLQIPMLTQEQIDIIENFQPNAIEHIFVNNIEILPVTINSKPRSIGINFLEFTQAEKTKLSTIENGAEVNKIESISVNGTEFNPVNKAVNLVLDLAKVQGARYPVGNTHADIEITDKKLELSRIAATGNIDHLIQTAETYIILNCGSSTEVI